MALRCLVEKVGRIGYNNHVKTKLGFYGAVVNNYQHPPSRHSSFRWYSRKRYRTSLGPPDTSDCLEIYPDYWKYSQQVDASEGFDVEAGLHLGPIGGGIHPYWWGSMDDPEITEPALVAVQQYNKQQNTNLEFVRVVKATMQCICGMRYYITLEAMDNGVKNTYQTKMWLNAGKNCIWVLELFRLAPDNRSNLIDKQGGISSGMIDFVMIITQIIPEFRNKVNQEKVNI
uniref:Cysteine proteinase inhibitor n=1 Tax=Davidia involucrata TaxID=16924 RepID=A0A5B7APG0_DAVIN